jgi:hypothetical protein
VVALLRRLRVRVLRMSERPAKEPRGPRAVPSPPPRPESEAPAGDAAGRADQLGAIIVKTLDLAEAGLSLGITVLSRAGAVAQEALAERRPAVPTAHVNAHGQTYVPEAPAEVDVAPGEQPPEEPFFLTNRLPLAPGGQVQVSFSINNDSLVEPKRVNVRVDGFVGEYQGVRFDAAGFAVRPARKTIAPMDFEKFVLAGPLPAELPPDVYRGAVLVTSTDELSIPVRLLVAEP